jgi:hypothetical protein
MMNAWNTTSPTELEILFTALKEEFPEMGTYWLNCLERRYTPQQLAAEMAIDLRQEKRQQEKELEDAQQALYQSEELFERQLEELRSKLEIEKNIAQEKEEKFIALNRIIAQQQEQLNALLGNEA